MAPHPFTTNPLASREDLQHALTSLLDSLEEFTTPGGAQIHLGLTATHYDSTAAALEGFSRPLWGLASHLAGGGAYPGAERWIKGFENGTDPESPEFWGATRGKDQRMVEMSAMGFTLAVARDQIWERLSNKGKDSLVTWLGGINGKEMPDTNWLWFRVFTNLGLRSVQRPYSESQLKADLDHLDTFYLGDGWSRDGPPGVRQLDFYSSSFAIQFAQLVYSKLAQKDDRERCEEYRKRARQFALDFVHYFDEHGRPIPFGRSLIYRFATSSFWGALAFADVLPPAPLNDWGVIKGLLLRNIRYYARLPILSPSGTLTIGYTYPNTFMTENYNSPGSPYWAFKAFIPLSLPADHPFWTTPERPYPSTSIPLSVSLRHPSHIVTRSGGHTFLLSSGQACHYPLRHGAEKYGKFAYSSAFGYAVPTGAIGIDMWNPDCTIALSEDDGERWVVRRHVEPNDPSKEDGGFLESDGSQSWLRATWKPWKDTEVETWLFPPTQNNPNWHIRIHRVRSTRQLLSSDAGFSIYGQGGDGRALNIVGQASELGQGFGKFESSEPAFALARSAAGVSGVYDLTEKFFPNKRSVSRNGRAFQLDANANIISSRSSMPTLIGSHTASDHDDVWFATGVFAAPNEAGVLGSERKDAQTEGLKHVDWLEQWKNLPELPESVRSILKA